MALIGVHDLKVSFGGDAPLVDGVTFHIEAGERVALVGRNGSGKSTLLKVVAGEIEPDAGARVVSATTRIARLTQEVPRDVAGEVFDIVASGLDGLGELFAEYQRLNGRLASGADEADLDRLARVQAKMDAASAWQQERRVETVMSRLGLPSRERFETLSGGLARRVLLARALVAEPDLLLLDEPTNHFDIPAIEWLEEMLLGFAGTLVFVTHDRAFLAKLATRILELDRGRLHDCPGDYARFVELQRQRLEVEAAQAVRFDQRLAREEAWIRQGIKARRTRDEGRVRALERLRAERRARRAAVGQARLRVDDSERSGKVVIEAEDAAFAHGDGPPIVDGFSTRILRGDKVGILGPNGSGKTTLIGLLLGRLEPNRGLVRRGSRLEVAYFDQHREQLDEARSVADNVADGNDRVIVGGRPRHVISYLQDFLFPAVQTRSPVSSLSGGERNRLLLARLFTRPFNFLVMDEPTNDLDVETLELLEALLVEFNGTLLLVSHDRVFLDHVVSSTLVMEGGGRVGEYAGGYSDWLLQRPRPAPAEARRRPAGETPTPAASRRGQPGRRRPRKLGYREKQELEALPDRIEALEAEQAELHAAFADPALYRADDGAAAAAARRRLAEVDAELAAAYERWGELEALPG